MFKVNNKDTRTTSLKKIMHVIYLAFEQVNAGWAYFKNGGNR